MLSLRELPSMYMASARAVPAGGGAEKEDCDQGFRCAGM